MKIILIIWTCGLLAGTLSLIFYFKRLEKEERSISRIINKKRELECEKRELECKKRGLDQAVSAAEMIIEDLKHEEKLAEKAKSHAIEMADKELELELAKQKENYNKQLDEELARIKTEHPLTDYQKTVEQLKSEIDEHHITLQLLQTKQREAEEKEDFIKTHSIRLSPIEKSDISLIRGFAPKLSFKEVIYKLIWSQFYQSKLQELRKSLGADKVTGIYKITDIENDKSYIGQALDIGARWCDHVKSGLSIGIIRPNKFYSAMIEKGPETFTFEILEECSKEKLDEREKYWINFYDSISRGYNTKAGG